MTEDYGQLLDRERDAAAELLAYAFPDEPAFGDRARHVPLEYTFAVRHNGQLASVVLWEVTTVLHHGTESRICLAGPGATHPAQRRQGGLAAAQQNFLAAMRQTGCVLSGLETPITRWHRRNGWDVASAVRRYSASPGCFRLFGNGTVAGGPTFDADVQTVDTIRRAAADHRFGFLTPHPHHRAHPFELRTDTVVWEEERQPTGLLHYSHRRSQAGHATTIVVHELLTTSAAAYTGLLGLMSEHNNVTTIVWNAPVDDPLQQLVIEPRDVQPVIVPDKMVRIVDLTKLAVPRLDGDGGDELTLELHDRHAPWNSGIWRMTADRAVYRFCRTNAKRADLRAEVDILGPIFTGHLTSAAAAMTGRLHGELTALQQLDRVRARWAPPYCPDTW